MSNTAVTITPGTLPQSCYSNNQQFANDILNQATAVVPGTLAYVMQASTPSSDDRDKLWIKLSGSAPVGQYVFYSGQWVWPHPIPASDSRLVLFTGLASAVNSLDGGNGNSVSNADGPFWQIETALDARFPVGVGTFDGGDSVTVGGTGGSDEVTLTTDHLPAHAHNTPYSVDGVGGGGAQSPNEGYMANDAPSGTPRADQVSSETGGGQPHTNLPPYYGVYFLKRTARIYYVG